MPPAPARHPAGKITDRSRPFAVPAASVPRFAGLLPATTPSAEATEALGAALGARLVPGDVLALHGDLGAGKTRLVRGLVAGLGGDPGEVSSPTFTLVHEYDAAGVHVYHVDAYRLAQPDDFRRIGGDELLEAGQAVVVVEWPERLGGLLPAATLHVQLVHGGGDLRRVIEGAPEAA